MFHRFPGLALAHHRGLVIDGVIRAMTHVVFDGLFDGGDENDEDDSEDAGPRRDRGIYGTLDDGDEEKEAVGHSPELLEEVLGQEVPPFVLGGLDDVALVLMLQRQWIL